MRATAAYGPANGPAVSVPVKVAPNAPFTLLSVQWSGLARTSPVYPPPSRTSILSTRLAVSGVPRCNIDSSSFLPRLTAASQSTGEPSGTFGGASNDDVVE